MTPTLDELATQFKVAKINIDENRALTERYGVSAIPAFLVFKDGKVVERLVGIRSKPTLAAIMMKYQ